MEWRPMLSPFHFNLAVCGLKPLNLVGNNSIRPTFGVHTSVEFPENVFIRYIGPIQCDLWKVGKDVLVHEVDSDVTGTNDDWYLYRLENINNNTAAGWVFNKYGQKKDEVGFEDDGETLKPFYKLNGETDGRHIFDVILWMFWEYDFSGEQITDIPVTVQVYNPSTMQNMSHECIKIQNNIYYGYADIDQGLVYALYVAYGQYKDDMAFGIAEWDDSIEGFPHDFEIKGYLIDQQ